MLLQVALGFDGIVAECLIPEFLSADERYTFELGGEVPIFRIGYKGNCVRVTLHLLLYRILYLNFRWIM